MARVGSGSKPSSGGWQETVIGATVDHLLGREMVGRLSGANSSDLGGGECGLRSLEVVSGRGVKIEKEELG